MAGADHAVALLKATRTRVRSARTEAVVVFHRVDQRLRVIWERWVAFEQHLVQALVG